METWYDYRAVWANHRWVMAYAIIVAAVLVLAIVGTILEIGIFALLFIPALAGVYVHHLLVQKRLPGRD